jgi:hypothetical protein
VTALTVVSPDAVELSRATSRLVAGSLAELKSIVDVSGGRTLDLVGHSTAGHHLLRLGRTVIDMLDPAVAQFFYELARTGPALAGLRLLGCQTAVTEAGQRTIRMLARTLRTPVWGTRVPLLDAHSTVDGFNPAFAHLLVCSAELTRR